VAKWLDRSRWHVAWRWTLVQATLFYMGTQLPSPKKGAGGTAPQFSAHVYCGQTAVCIRIPLGTEVGLSLGNIRLDGDPVPPPLKGHSPQFLAHVCCGQTAGWTKKMLLGIEVPLSLGEVGKMGTAAPLFLADLYCSHGRPSQLLLSSCKFSGPDHIFRMSEARHFKFVVQICW